MCAILTIVIVGVVGVSLVACNGDFAPSFVNPGDSLGGGGTVQTPPTSDATDENAQEIKDVVGSVPSGEDLPEGATYITQSTEITVGGDYVVSGQIDGAITIKKSAGDVHLYLDNATIYADGKAIDSKSNLTITLIGENVVDNATNGSTEKNALDCSKDLVINGSGSLSVKSLKNGISSNTITIKDATVSVEANKDGLHAEISAYDDITTAPTFSYDDGGYVYLDGAKLDINSVDDGIQADTFVCITGESDISILTNGGAPSKITESSSDNVDGKGIKAGQIDWGVDDNELESEQYLILIESGTINVNSNDDAIHSNGTMQISGGVINVLTGDDGLHADYMVAISGGQITVENCYEGIEGAKVEISGGKIDVVSVDDGINAADGTGSIPGRPNSNCHLIISGGEVLVNAQGDGLDSNGTMLISGGMVLVAGPTSGANAALDSDGGILINGGYVCAVGTLGMVETPASNSQQNVVSYAYSGTIPAGTTISLTDANGNVIFYFDAPKSCQSVIMSCPELAKGSTYNICGGTTTLTTFTVSSTITTIGSSGSMGGGRPGSGGMGGGPRG